MDYKKYLREFEGQVIVQGVQTGVFGTLKESIIPLKAGKFAGTRLEKALGRSFDFKQTLGVDFYGYYKHSSGIIQIVKEAERIFPGIRSIKAPVIHFNSITSSQIANLNPALLADFDDFKKWLTDIRFRKSF